MNCKKGLKRKKIIITYLYEFKKEKNTHLAGGGGTRWLLDIFQILLLYIYYYYYLLLWIEKRFKEEKRRTWREVGELDGEWGGPPLVLVLFLVEAKVLLALLAHRHSRHSSDHPDLNSPGNNNDNYHYSSWPELVRWRVWLLYYVSCNNDYLCLHGIAPTILTWTRQANSKNEYLSVHDVDNSPGKQ